MSQTQIRFKDLLKDPIYKAWIQRTPTFKIPLRAALPWRTWVQRREHGPWAFKDHKTYPEAYNLLIRELRAGAWDGAVGCQSRESPRPMMRKGMKPLRNPDTGKILRTKDGKPRMIPNRVRWKTPANQHWCPFCRRPVRWAYYHTKHHAMPGIVDASSRRCRICGVREVFVRRYHRGQ